MAEKNNSIAYMKAILVINMILAHCIQILYTNNETSIVAQSFQYFSLLVNIITFSSFLFAFGYVFYIAYLSKEPIPKNKIIKNGITTLMIYYFSAISISILNDAEVSIQKILNILLFNEVIMYSEFLLSFAGISFIGVFFSKSILKITSNVYLLIITSCILFAYSIIPTELGIFIGSNQFASFPVLLYLPYFLFGIYISQNKIIFNKNITIVSLAILIAVICYILINKDIPNRFPPDFFWLISALPFTYLLYIFSNYFSNSLIKNNKLILNIGSNTLFFLLFSNVMIFFIKNHFSFVFTWQHILIIFSIIIFAGIWIIKIIRK